jgi:SAM-dependent methyltransferase
MDWGLGSYRRIAQELLPAAASAVEAAGVLPGERVLDVGCGTGNAALLAAERGARVTGVDPTPSLLALAVADAEDRGVEATFVAGDAGGLPVPDASIDVVISVFGVIFAPDAQAAAAELGRVTAPAGRIVLTAWLPGGVFAEAIGLRRRAVAAAGPGGDVLEVGSDGFGEKTAGPPPASWHDREWVAGLLGPLGFAVEVQERTLAFTGASARDFAEAELADHPMWVGTRNLLEPRGDWPALHERAIELFERANGDPEGFRVTSRYVLVSARRAL